MFTKNVWRFGQNLKYFYLNPEKAITFNFTRMAMSLSVGKKAAAVEAVNRYVKVLFEYCIIAHFQ